MKKNILIITLILISISFKISAQDKLPNTDLYLVSINKTDSGIVFGATQRIGDSKEYDNQPFFSFDSQFIYYSSSKLNNNADIYMYYIPTRQDNVFIETSGWNEFSPKITPNEKGLSLVRQENSTQTIWEYFFDGTEPVCLTPDIKNVGYYTWISDNDMLIRLEGKENSSSLIYYNLKTKIPNLICNKPGMSLAKVPAENAAYYIDKSAYLTKIMKYNVETQKSDSVTTIPTGFDEFYVTASGDIWYVNAGKLFAWSPYKPKWEILKDFGIGAKGEAYRLAVSRDEKKLVLVTKPEY
jgi:hypothetical protein